MSDKKEKKNKGWMRIADIVTERTADQRKMLGRYTAETVVRHWTEDFVDEDTKETVSIERRELIVRKGVKLDKDTISGIMFHIQAGDIEDVLVTDSTDHSELYVPERQRACEVTLSANCEKKMYLVKAQTVQKAVEAAQNYATMYCGMEGEFTVRKVEFKPYIICYKRYDEKTVGDMLEEVLDLDNPTYEEKKLERFKCTAKMGTYDSFEEKMNYTTSEIIIQAEEVGQAKTRAYAYLSEVWKEELEKSEANSLKIIKAAPYTVEAVVPEEYCQMFREKPTDMIFN